MVRPTSRGCSFAPPTLAKRCAQAKRLHAKIWLNMISATLIRAETLSLENAESLRRRQRIQKKEIFYRLCQWIYWSTFKRQAWVDYFCLSICFKTSECLKFIHCPAEADYEKIDLVKVKNSLTSSRKLDWWSLENWELRRKLSLRFRAELQAQPSWEIPSIRKSIHRWPRGEGNVLEAQVRYNASDGIMQKRNIDLPRYLKLSFSHKPREHQPNLTCAGTEP